MAGIEREVRGRGGTRLRADVSITAELFFRRMGFRVIKRQVKIYRNQASKQAVMEKRLKPRGRLEENEDGAFGKRKKVRGRTVWLKADTLHSQHTRQARRV